MKDLSVQTLWPLEDKARYPTTLRGAPTGRIYRGIQWGVKLKSDLYLENDPTLTPLQLPTRKVLSQSKKISKRCYVSLESCNITTPVTDHTSWSHANIIIISLITLLSKIIILSCRQCRPLTFLRKMNLPISH